MHNRRTWTDKVKEGPPGEESNNGPGMVPPLGAQCEWRHDSGIVKKVKELICSMISWVPHKRKSMREIEKVLHDLKAFFPEQPGIPWLSHDPCFQP